MARGYGTLKRPERRAICRYRDLLVASCGVKLNGCIGTGLDEFSGEVFRFDPQPARNAAVNGELAVGIGATEQRAIGLLNACACDYGAGLVND